MLHPDRATAERAYRTIFFSDIRGFTKIAGTQPPEAAMRMLSACLGLQADRVESYNGRLDKFVGDSVVAVFDGEDMALRAVRCAIDIQDALRKENTNRHPELKVGIGMVTDEIIVGSLGSDDPADFTIIGPGVRRCARLCGVAREYEILIDRETCNLVKDPLGIDRLEAVDVPGLDSPTYRIAGP